MTKKEFTSQVHFCTDSGTIRPMGRRYCGDRAEVIPATGSGNAAALFKLLCAGVRANKPVDDSLSRLDRAIASLARDTALREQQEARRKMKIEGEPSADELAAQWRRDYAAREAQICAEAKAFYDSRNPHKRKEGAK